LHSNDASGRGGNHSTSASLDGADSLELRLSIVGALHSDGTVEGAAETAEVVSLRVRAFCGCSRSRRSGTLDAGVSANLRSVVVDRVDGSMLWRLVLGVGPAVGAGASERRAPSASRAVEVGGAEARLTGDVAKLRLVVVRGIPALLRSPMTALELGRRRWPLSRSCDCALPERGSTD
jgi:hypothetical protein